MLSKILLSFLQNERDCKNAFSTRHSQKSIRPIIKNYQNPKKSQKILLKVIKFCRQLSYAKDSYLKTKPCQFHLCTAIFISAGYYQNAILLRYCCCVITSNTYISIYKNFATGVAKPMHPTTRTQHTVVSRKGKLHSHKHFILTYVFKKS